MSNATMSNTAMSNSTPSAPQSAQSTESSFHSYDGTRIFYRYWLSSPLENLSKTDNPKIMVLLHRGHEHSARLGEMAQAFVNAGYQVFAWDARGNGLSEGERDHAESFGQLVRDLDEFIREINRLTGVSTEQMMVCASSLGAVIAGAWVHDYAPKLRGLILGTPALAIRLYVPFAMPALKVAKKVGLMNRVSSYVKAKVLTHDTKAQQAYNDDELISTSISRDLLIDSLMTGKRLLDDAGAITTPTFILCAGKDFVVDKGAIRSFYERLCSPTKRWAYYADSYHAIFHELNKAQVYQDCIDFADELFAKPFEMLDLTDADTSTEYAKSYSRERVDAFMAKGFNPEFAITRFAINKFGAISDGVATGVEHGFDSGSSLEKVYQNSPNGKNILGKWVDNFYLNNIGWRGIRIRKEHLVELASVALGELSNTNSDLKAMDIASGNGFYMFEIQKAHPKLSLILRDYDTHNIAVMSQKISEYGLTDKAVAVQKDAFDPNSYDEMAVNLAVASGVFELFSDNALVRQALTGIASTLADDGYLIYTNQPWHPEQEFIGKTLNSHQGKDWVMRCRSQAEMDQLVEQAGFEKVAMRIDPFGIFTVSLAKKVR